MYALVHVEARQAQPDQIEVFPRPPTLYPDGYRTAHACRVHRAAFL